jgi:hypothetical protein
VIDDFEAMGNQVSKVGDLSVGTFNPPPIKRIFTDDARKGTPYMLPQEMFDFYWAAKKYVLADKMKDIDSWFLKSGWIVLTQSGSVGKPYYATESDENIILSQNAIRIPPTDGEKSGYLYAYLSTWIGQTLLKKDEFGITVKHIMPHHVDSIPVPVISEKKQLEISRKVQSAFELRAEAIKLLNEAKALVYEGMGAPDKIPVHDEEDDA